MVSIVFNKCDGNKWLEMLLNGLCEKSMLCDKPFRRTCVEKLDLVLLLVLGPVAMILLCSRVRTGCLHVQNTPLPVHKKLPCSSQTLKLKNKCQMRPSRFLGLEFVTIFWRTRFNILLMWKVSKQQWFQLHCSNHSNIPPALSRRGTLSSETLAKKARNWAFDTPSFLSVYFFSLGGGAVWFL